MGLFTNCCICGEFTVPPFFKASDLDLKPKFDGNVCLNCAGLTHEEYYIVLKILKNLPYEATVDDIGNRWHPNVNKGMATLLKYKKSLLNNKKG